MPWVAAGSESGNRRRTIREISAGEFMSCSNSEGIKQSVVWMDCDDWIHCFALLGHALDLVSPALARAAGFADARSSRLIDRPSNLVEAPRDAVK